MEQTPTKAIVAVIANGASLSGAVELDGLLVGIQMPTAWTAAGITFQASADGTNFFDVKDSAGTEVSLTAAASTYITLDPAARNFKAIKVRSGTSAAAVNQGAERVLVLMRRMPS